MADIKVKVYGERNTAAELVGDLIADNFDVDMIPGTAGELAPDWVDQTKRLSDGREVSPQDALILREAWLDRLFQTRLRDTFGWMAAAPPLGLIEGMDEAVHFVVVTRHAYSWLAASHARPLNLLTARPASLADYVRAPWVATRRENCPPLLASPVDLWVFKMRSYLMLAQLAAKKGHRLSLVRYEDVVRDQEAVLERLAKDLPRKADGAFETRPVDGHSLGEGKALDDDTRAFVNERLNDALIAKFRYAKA